MIIGRGEGKERRRLLLFGLSAQNMARLLNDEPIYVTPETHLGGWSDGLDLEVMICFGETEDVLAKRIVEAVKMANPGADVEVRNIRHHGPPKSVN